MEKETVVIEPMTETFLLWRCLHGGPLSCETIDEYPPENPLPWARYRDRNLLLLRKLTRTYGACAMLARDGDRVVGHLRFYAKAVWAMEGAGGLCLQQDAPSGPDDHFVAKDFPPPGALADKTLSVHCLMTGCPQQKDNPYQRKGIGTRLVQALVEWARANGWQAIEAKSFEDLPIIYIITGQAGHTFWEKLGFSLISRYPHPELQTENEFVATLETQARAAGIAPERARDELVMRLELNA